MASPAHNDLNIIIWKCIYQIGKKETLHHNVTYSSIFIQKYIFESYFALLEYVSQGHSASILLTLQTGK